MLRVPLNVALLRALGREPLSLAALRRAAGSPPQTTMRAYLRALADDGLVRRERGDSFPGNVECRLTEAGGKLLVAAATLSAWLAAFPDGPTELGGAGAKNSIGALVEGWSTSIVHALAIRSLTLTELSAVIKNVSYPSLERRLSALRSADLVDFAPGEGRGRPYAPTDWLRRSVLPLAAAADWERTYLGEDAAPVRKRDVEAALLLLLPLLQVSAEQSGSCRLAVELRNGSKGAVASVFAAVRDGAVAPARPRLPEEVDAWAFGSLGDWHSAVSAGRADSLELGGDCGLVLELVEALREAPKATVENQSVP